jgi:hypothetical protein
MESKLTVRKMRNSYKSKIGKRTESLKLSNILLIFTYILCQYFLNYLVVVIIVIVIIVVIILNYSAISAALRLTTFELYPLPPKMQFSVLFFGVLKREYQCTRPVLVNSRRLADRCSDTDHCPVGLFSP